MISTLKYDLFFPTHVQKEFVAVGVALCLLVVAWFGGLFDSDDGGVELEQFPDFSTVADDGVTYSNSNYAGEPYIVLFSAEWCDSPCHATMHAINSALNDASMIVLSTDPADNPQGITLEDWHSRANAYDDDGEDLGQTLDFPFAKGIEEAEKVEISSRPSIVFVNSDGGIVEIHKGGLSDADEIRAYWESAGGSV